jgi:hypothetical protein
VADIFLLRVNGLVPVALSSCDVTMAVADVMRDGGLRVVVCNCRHYRLPGVPEGGSVRQRMIGERQWDAQRVGQLGTPLVGWMHSAMLDVG